MQELNPPTTARAASAILAAWVLSLGIDIFLHAGVLAHLYREPSPFLLTAEQALRRIPIGYLAFLGLTVSLYWLLQQLRVRGAMAGFRLAAVAGAIVWGALALGLYSISTAPLPLLGGWWFGQTIELGTAGAVLGASASGARLGRIWKLVIAAVVACLIGIVVLQTLGLAPPMKVAG